jgi:hypothetical protein
MYTVMDFQVLCCVCLVSWLYTYCRYVRKNEWDPIRLCLIHLNSRVHVHCLSCCQCKRTFNNYRRNMWKGPVPRASLFLLLGCWTTNLSVIRFKNSPFRVWIYSSPMGLLGQWHCWVICLRIFLSLWLMLEEYNFKGSTFTIGGRFGERIRIRPVSCIGSHSCLSDRPATCQFKYKQHSETIFICLIFRYYSTTWLNNARQTSASLILFRIGCAPQI